MNDWNALENLARHLDGEFQTASKYGGLEDPGLFVRQIVGAQHEVDFLSQNEMRFLLGGSNDLVYEISEIQRRIKNDLHFVTVFNDLKKDCERFVMSCPEIKLEVDGDSAAGQFSGLNTQRAKMKIGTMNMLISDVITSLEEDRPRISAIVQEFVRLGRETYGSDFPAKKVEKRMPEPC